MLQVKKEQNRLQQYQSLTQDIPGLPSDGRWFQLFHSLITVGNITYRSGLHASMLWRGTRVGMSVSLSISIEHLQSCLLGGSLFR